MASSPASPIPSGITSSYTYLYGSGDFITTLTTPYGVTHFTYGDSTTNYRLGTSRFVTLTDPLGQTERVEYRQIRARNPAQRSSKHRSRRDVRFQQLSVVPKHLRLGQASISASSASRRHAGLHQGNDDALAPRGQFVRFQVLESVKQSVGKPGVVQLPERVTGDTAGTSNQPTAIGRVLDDGTTQVETLQRNSFGFPIQFIDPIGRQMTMTYASNGIDLISTANTTGGGNYCFRARPIIPSTSR